MEELTWVIEDALSWLVATWKNEILTTVNVVQEVSNTPDLILHVQNLDTWSTVTSFISQYIPFFSQYTDTEFFFFCLVALIWIMVVIWVFRDAIARSNSWFYQFISVLLVVLLTPIFWLPIYLAFRPLVYKWERRLWRESLEMDICECHHCWALNKESSRMCVWCWECLVVECKECHKEYNNSYAYCPNCWAPNLE
jgi:hypothetical protein